MHKVFYSWQSDLPNKTNRGFIEKALTDAAESIRSDESIAVEPVIDRDTEGIPGAPDIASTIFGKIDAAKVFVCDVSIIGLSGNRATPNPNVLLELGYAVRALSWRSIIMVLNVAYGGPELLPFDLRMRRVVTYKMTEAAERAQERRRLESVLTSALRTIFEDRGGPMPGEVIQPKPRTSVADRHPDFSTTDMLVFKIGGEQAFRRGTGMVHEGEFLALTRSENLTDDAVYESLQMLQSRTYIKIKGVHNTSRLFHSFTLTPLGLDEYASQYIEKYESLPKSVAHQLTNLKVLDSKAISEALNEPILLINHIVNSFAEKGWLKVIKSHTGDYNLHAYNLSPVLNRLLE